jgi:hypothetical protein
MYIKLVYTDGWRWHRLVKRQKDRDTSLGITIRYGLDGSGSTPDGGKTFSLLYTSPQMSRPTESPVQWVQGLFLGGKAAGACRCPFTRSKTEIKNAKRYTSTPPL